MLTLVASVVRGTIWRLHPPTDTSITLHSAVVYTMN